MRRTKSGFTLIETIVVLVISAMILGLSLTMSNHVSLNRLHDYFFWKRFQNQFELCESIASTYHDSTVIEFHPHRNVEFTNHQIKDRTIEMPKNLSTIRMYTLEITKNGHVNPQSLLWTVDGRPRLIQKFQLGWGMYHVDKKK